jgi:hypothetical protein
MSARFHRRFPAARRQACVPVTSARADEAREPHRARAAGQASGEGTSPDGSGPAPVDLKSRGSKE